MPSPAEQELRLLAREGTPDRLFSGYKQAYAAVYTRAEELLPPELHDNLPLSQRTAIALFEQFADTAAITSVPRNEVKGFVYENKQYMGPALAIDHGITRFGVDGFQARYSPAFMQQLNEGVITRMSTLYRTQDPVLKAALTEFAAHFYAIEGINSFDNLEYVPRTDGWVWLANEGAPIAPLVRNGEQIAEWGIHVSTIETMDKNINRVPLVLHNQSELVRECARRYAQISRTSFMQAPEPDSAAHNAEPVSAAVIKYLSNIPNPAERSQIIQEMTEGLLPSRRCVIIDKPISEDPESYRKFAISTLRANGFRIMTQTKPHPNRFIGIVADKLPPSSVTPVQAA